jgi:hypothetical protein
VVLLDSPRITRVLGYSGVPTANFDFNYEAITPSGQTFQSVHLSNIGSVNWDPTTPRVSSIAT